MIDFYSENDFNLLHTTEVIQWITHSINLMNKSLGNITFIFCNDTYLLKINQEFLRHDTYTDIISFDYSETDTLSGDIFISTERVFDNAQSFKSSFTDELHRVIIHGVLHFAGFKDKTDKDADEMRKQEDYYLSLRTF